MASVLPEAMGSFCVSQLYSEKNLSSTQWEDDLWLLREAGEI